MRASDRWGTAASRWIGAASAFVLAATLWVLAPDHGVGSPIPLSTVWVRHTIQLGASGSGSADGADGVNMADVDGDGLLDVATGYEQGLMGEICFNPGPSLVESEWPCVELPAVPPDSVLCSPEDFVIADLNADGDPEVIAACETGTDRVTIFVNPGGTRTTMLDGTNWTRVGIDSADAASARFMRIAVADVTGDATPEIFAGGKESSGPDVAAAIGYFTTSIGSVSNPAAWAWNPIAADGWTMDMYVADVNGDTELDLVAASRDPVNVPSLDNSFRGIYWHAGDGLGGFGTRNQISDSVADYKWFDLADKDADGDLDILACRSNASLNFLRWYINGGNFASFTTQDITFPTSVVGRCQEQTYLDIDGDTVKDIVVTGSNATNLDSVWWMRSGDTYGTIAGVLDVDSDVKMDNHKVTDIDGDGDLDVVTTEQHMSGGSGPGLGIIYFENPLAQFIAPPAPASVDCTILTSAVGTGASSFQPASISPVANSLILVGVQSAIAAPNTPTITGNGLTYTQINTVTFHTSNARRLTTFRALGATPSAGQPTIDFGGQSQTSAIWSIIQCTGVDTTTPVVQSITNSVSSSTSLTVTLASPPAASSATVCWSGIAINGATGPDAQFTELSDNQTATGVQGHESAWAAVAEQANTTTFGSANAGGSCSEVAIAP